MQKRIIVLVSNDLATDQRVQKVCKSLVSMGYSPFLMGRVLPNSPKMPTLNFEYSRSRLWFNAGPLFYMELNIRIFFRLLFMKYDGIHSNDLDTLLPSFLVSRIRSKRLVYDTHEYFTGVPELVNRPSVRKVWRFIESSIFPKLKHVYTVNDSIADLYEDDYGIRPLVMRNIPEIKEVQVKTKSRTDFGLSETSFILILQGSGINVHRGAEEAVEMMRYLPECLLVIAGSGDVIEQLKLMAKEDELKDKIMFFPRMPYHEMMEITRCCDVGLTLDKDTNINYKFSLPNKLFDYIHAGIPVLASDLPEVRKIIEDYNVGLISSNHEPKQLAEIIQNLRKNQELYLELKSNCLSAQPFLTWALESKVLKEAYENDEQF
jgi:glycosyltransferase involved in cell wall biosynthesis